MLNSEEQMFACSGLKHIRPLRSPGRQDPYAPQYYNLCTFPVFLNLMSLIATEESFALNSI
jgi:hypothetical protein